MYIQENLTEPMAHSRGKQCDIFKVLWAIIQHSRLEQTETQNAFWHVHVTGIEISEQLKLHKMGNPVAYIYPQKVEKKDLVNLP